MPRPSGSTTDRRRIGDCWRWRSWQGFLRRCGLIAAQTSVLIVAHRGFEIITIDAGLRGDIPLLMGIVMFCAVLVFTGNSIANALLLHLNRGVARQS